VSGPQTVVLTVIDGNGCEATQQVTVNAHCKNGDPVNTFTPNGDGINDTWKIPGIGTDQHSRIDIYNRSEQR